MTLEYKYPAVEFLKPKARRRIPHFVWEYLDSGTGAEVTHKRNRTIFEDIKMMRPGGGVSGNGSFQYDEQNKSHPSGLAEL